MKRMFILLMLLTTLLLAACGGETVYTQPDLTSEPTATDVQTQPQEPVPSYSSNAAVEDVIRYFNEVCLDSEIINSGDPRKIQKWMKPVLYTLEGDYTQEDLAVIQSFVRWINSVEGFPGMAQTEDPGKRNLRICFGSQQQMLQTMGNEFVNMDGAVTFWYEDDRIYDAVIFYRTDLNQQLRNSVILEELYNGLGPIQDTLVRPDSIIYQQFSQPQWLSEMDELLMRLLYHPDVQPGMDAAQCEQVIRRLYKEADDPARNTQG